VGAWLPAMHYNLCVANVLLRCCYGVANDTRVGAWLPAMHYNPATHDVHIMAKTLKEVPVFVQSARGGMRESAGAGREEREW